MFVAGALLASLIISPAGHTLMSDELLSIYRETTFYDPNGCSSSTDSNNSSSVFDTSKLTLYEAQTEADPGVVWAQSEAGKNYATTTLGILSTDIKLYPKAEVENMIAAETARQFGNLSDKFGSTLSQATQALLSYQEQGNNSFQLFITQSGKLIPGYESEKLNIFSLSNDSFNNNGKGKNKRVAASYDIKYAIYLGVKEAMSHFTTDVTGTGESRWKSTLSYMFLPTELGCYWDGVVSANNTSAHPEWVGLCSRSAQTAPAAWAAYANYSESGGYNTQCGTSATGLTAVVTIAQQEYQKNNNKLAFGGGANIAFPGSDYSAGVVEHWCADFVSWVYKQANLSFTDGVDGWRISGVPGLITYFQTKHTFVVIGQEPKPGDLIFYESTLGDPSSGFHVEIISSYDAPTKTITYIGGNECSGSVAGCQYPYSEIVTRTIQLDADGTYGNIAGYGRYRR